MKARTVDGERAHLEARLANYRKTLGKTSPAGRDGIQILIAEVERELRELSEVAPNTNRNSAETRRA
jgi:hypothetical protein